MLLALRVGQVASFVVVQSETEFALVGSQVIFHKVGVLGDVDGLERQLAQALATIAVGVRGRSHATAAGFPAGAVLEIHRRISSSKYDTTAVKEVSKIVSYKKRPTSIILRKMINKYHST